MLYAVWTCLALIATLSLVETLRHKPFNARKQAMFALVSPVLVAVTMLASLTTIYFEGNLADYISPRGPIWFLALLVVLWGVGFCCALVGRLVGKLLIWIME